MSNQKAPTYNAKRVKIVFDQSDGPVNARDLAHFLYLFRAAYAQSLNEEETVAQSLDDPMFHKAFWMAFKSGFSQKSSAKQVANLFDADLGQAELEILQIAKASPLTMTVKGSLVALVLATILSGGKIDVKLMKITLPPIGVGIKSLHDAFSRPEKPLKPAPKRSLALPNPNE